ncbi:DegV family protein [Paenibacillus sp. ACRRX]|uniref:DegV family protein n=1 Tax=unclassified Paenibacillus TaxID=185978 RepID=UPI001EF5FA76|nr:MULTISPECIES: DegV family protein [unclassified Paenibacillus]MCG7407590.1 DegV family protein [Paenibacillus sp. ACRRX]MDK8180825.1 DegV family protein [Paenibacillus sp. UMB4589-SE434]
MAQVRIVTDSTADIPLELRERYGIEMVPLKVHFGQEMYKDAITIEPDQFYDKLVQSSKLPTTSQPSPIEFVDVFKRLNEEPETSIISIHLSSALSGTYQSAMLASNMMEEEADITVVDSRSASYGFGLFVVEAAKMAQNGQSKEEILEMIARMQQARKLFFLVDSLEFLQKGGRIGKAAAMFGTLLNIKPILSIDPVGEVYAMEKVRGYKKALQRIIEILSSDFAEKPIHLAIGYGKVKESADEVVAALQTQFDIRSVQYTRIGAVVGTHVGPGVVAMFVWPAEVSADKS